MCVGHLETGLKGASASVLRRLFEFEYSLDDARPSDNIDSLVGVLADIVVSISVFLDQYVVELVLGAEEIQLSQAVFQAGLDARDGWRKRVQWRGGIGLWWRKD